jgi:hypothetical protein
MGVRGRLDEVVLSVLSIGGGRERRSSAIFGTRRFFGFALFDSFAPSFVPDSCPN